VTGESAAFWVLARQADARTDDNCPHRGRAERLGHASIQMTADVYGHLFPRSDDGAELAAAEQALLA
jgi:integrase